MGDLQKPPTEAEIAEAIAASKSYIGVCHASVIRRLAFERDGLAAEIERLRAGLRGIRREFGHASINNGTSTLGRFIDLLVRNDVVGAKQLEEATEAALRQKASEQ